MTKPETTKKPLYVGIDLGTTNSVISYTRDGKEVKVIPTPNGSKTSPSIVKIKEGKITVGEENQREYNLGSLNTKGSFKVNMGSAQVYEADDKTYSPVDLSSKVLAHLKQYGEDHLGETIEEAVITVPAYFNDIQRQDTAKAAEIAGIKVARMINEPTACALAYGLTLDEERRVLVYDLGGGTFDVSLLQFSAGFVEVLNTMGNSNLGGDDFDKAIYNEIEKKLAKACNYLPSTPQAENVLKLLCRKAKEALADEETVQIDLAILKEVDPTFNVEFDVINISRKTVFKYVKPLLDITVGIIKECLEDVGQNNQPDEILLTGGSTRLFCLPEYIASETGMKVNTGGVDPDLSISIGAAIQHSIMGGSSDILLSDVTPFDLSVEVAQGLSSVIIKRQSSIPIKRDKEYTTQEDYAESLVFHITQGNNPMAKDNTSLGEIIIPISTPMPAVIPIIKVSFQIDSNGTLKVTAVNEATGEKETVTRKL